MADQIISCPKCGTEIPLNDALTSQIKSRFHISVSAFAREALEKKGMDEMVQKKLDAEKLAMWKKAQEEAGKRAELELNDLKKSNLEKEKVLDEMRKQELGLRQKTRELEEKEKNMQLEMARKMDEERKLLLEQAKKETEESMRMKMLEKDKQMEQMKKALEEANRKADQGSMQVQGDAQETDLKMTLQTAFPSDTIDDVPTGVRGADLIQTVFSSFGQKQGVIVWESKNTKAWNEEWVRKLKDDQSLVKGDIVVLATQVLPEGITGFGLRDGVWITEYKFALPLVSALRHQLIEMNRVKQSLVGKDAKMDLLYNYLSGSEFKNRIETIVMAFISLKSGLDAEKRAMEKIWNRREKEIERVIKNTTGFYGDLEGILGASLPAIKALELPTGDDDEMDKLL